MWNSFWDVVWYFFWIFAFIAYLIALVSIIADLFRDRALNGWYKALWIIFLLFVPFLTALIYLIARGGGMAERNQVDYDQAQDAARTYIRTAAGTSPSAEIAQAQALLEAGTITPAEFDTLKARALAQGA